MHVYHDSMSPSHLSHLIFLIHHLKFVLLPRTKFLKKFSPRADCLLSTPSSSFRPSLDRATTYRCKTRLVRTSSMNLIELSLSILLSLTELSCGTKGSLEDSLDPSTRMWLSRCRTISHLPHSMWPNQLGNLKPVATVVLHLNAFILTLILFKFPYARHNAQFS